MDYKKIYNSIINRAKTRTLDSYVERHHVIPKCMGGEDDEANIVALTAEEHYLAHQLLVKMYPDNQKLVYAAVMMTVDDSRRRRPNNKMYGWLKKRKSELDKDRIVSESSRQKMREAQQRRRAAEPKPEKNVKAYLTQEERSRVHIEARKKNPNIGHHTKHTIEAKEKMSKAATGKKHTDEWKAKMSELQSTRQRKPFTEETKLKMSISAKNRRVAQEEKPLCLQ